MRICVIGAGVIGVVSAYLLAREGHQITLLEQSAEAAELTSHANGGQLSYSYVAPLAAPGVIFNIPGWLLRKSSPLRFRPRLDLHQWRWLSAFLAACNHTTYRRTTAEMLTLSCLSRDVLHALLADEPLEFGLRRNGKLVVYRDAASFDNARALVGYQAERNVLQQVLSSDELLALEPALSAVGGGLAGAVYAPDDEAGDCAQFTRALCQRLMGCADVSVSFNTAVRGLHCQHGRIVAAATDQGMVEADAYVVASGMGSRALLRSVGEDVPLYGLKGYSLSVPLHGDTGAGPDISVTDYQRRIVYARLGDTLRIAAMVDIGDETIAPAPGRIEDLKRQVRDTFPRLDLSRAVTWTGLRPATPTGKPLIGRSRVAGNLWLNIGHGALGFTLACGSAAMLAALIADRASPIEPSAFKV